jgi:hypothetical protein
MHNIDLKYSYFNMTYVCSLPHFGQNLASGVKGFPQYLQYRAVGESADEVYGPASILVLGSLTTRYMINPMKLPIKTMINQRAPFIPRF